MEAEQVEVPLIELGILCKADGSARLAWKGKEVMAAVHGPAPVKTKQELIDTATVLVSLSPLNTPPNLVHNSMAIRIQRVLEKTILGMLHPRSLITIALQPTVLDDIDGSFAVLLNAAVLALLDAGIPLSSIPVAVMEGHFSAVYSFTSEETSLLYHSITGAKLTGSKLDQMLICSEQQSKTFFESIQQSIYRCYST